MVIKKFVGKNEEEATAFAKKELGEGIVIMNVRPVKAGGFLSMFRAPKVEVTVALEEDRAEHRSVSPQPQTQGAAGGRRGKETDEQTAKLEADLRDEKIKEDIIDRARAATGGMPSTAGIARAASAGKIPPLRVSPQTVPAVPVSDKADHIDLSTPGSGQELLKHAAAEMATATAADRTAGVQGTGMSVGVRVPGPENTGADVGSIEEKLDNLHNLLEQRIVPAPAKSGLDRVQSKRPEQEEEQVRVSVSADNAKAREESEAEKKAQEEALSFIRLLYNTLLENEVDEIYANELTDEVTKVAKPGASLDHALKGIYQKMVLKFGNPEIITPSTDGGPKAEIFIGPTGVGKTTTIAKLASKLHLQDKKKVALLTVDTYRIAAAEQLRTYATIMETPFRVIYSVEEMKQAIDDFKDFDYIMVDTAGHAVHNEEQKTNIINFIKVLSEDMETENFLVLSATTKYRDLIEITDAYSATGKYKLIFTKMDETLATGNLYNIRLRTGAPMSYITNGQDVPDDIEVFNAQKIVKVLLGGQSR